MPPRSPTNPRREAHRPTEGFDPSVSGPRGVTALADLNDSLAPANAEPPAAAVSPSADGGLLGIFRWLIGVAGVAAATIAILFVLLQSERATGREREREYQKMVDSTIKTLRDGMDRDRAEFVSSLKEVTSAVREVDRRIDRLDRGVASRGKER